MKSNSNSNKLTMVKKVTGNPSPWRLKQIGEHIVNWSNDKLNKPNVKRTLFNECNAVESNNESKTKQNDLETLGNLYQNFVKHSPKGAQAYTTASGFSELVKGNNINDIKINFKLSHAKAKALSLGEKVSRKPNSRKFPDEHAKKVVEFYLQDDISRVSTLARDKLKSGNKRFLYFPVYTVYGMFKDRNPNIKVSESLFRLLMPDLIRFVADIPLLTCVCVYCENVRLMLFLFPNINNEYELYTNLICKKEANQRFFNFKCIRKLCPKCCNWEDKMKSFLPNNTDYTKEYKFRSWKAIREVNNAGKPVVRRSLEPDSGTINKCLQHLTDAVVNPGRGFSFVEHFFRQQYQYDMYKECLNSLKPGECIFVQDFSKNKALVHQREIKASFWNQGQSSVHPTVIYYKIDETAGPKRLVITHISDIHSHSAQLVFYMTNDCIRILSEMFPEVTMKKVYAWSDGCASQYKGKTSFYYLDKCEIFIERNFFGSEHGKGESDAETGTISRKHLNAVRSNKAVILNAYDFHKFLSDNNDKKEKIYRLVTKEDLKAIHDNFVGINIGTLSGKCTRILHQIKPSGKEGFLLTRNYSCFCQSCLSGDFEKCDNHQFTGGKFIQRKLPSSSPNNDGNSGNDGQPNDENEDGEDVDTLIKYDTHNVDVVVEKQKINFVDLHVGDLVVVPVSTDSGIIYEFVAKINKIETEKDIEITYLRPKPEFPEILYIPNEKDIDCVEFEDIIMKVIPNHIHRGRYIFGGKILLNQN